MVAVQHFDAMDDQGQKLQDLESALGLASAFEQFSQAADLKKELDDVNANDVVKQILEVTDNPCHPMSISSGTFTQCASGHRAAICLSTSCHMYSQGIRYSIWCHITLIIHNIHRLSLQRQHA